MAALTFDLTQTPLRTVNSALHQPGLSGEFVIENPSGAHNVAVGVNAPVQIGIDGHVGYYAAGMNQQAEISINGNAGTGVRLIMGAAAGFPMCATFTGDSSLRGRPIMYSVERVKPADLSTYEDLADAKWKGRICVRSSSHIYNQSMLATMIGSGAPSTDLLRSAGLTRGGAFVVPDAWLRFRAP